eukprot:CAMPEP_0194194442 /NCGR_PEP_ID=MMETSP0154-20130528/75584_1 /TAXON_ID=1049557 /ORGANISM="Thalassiothrix antarctica, Strain L6-D1" /LENGTH=310 /DNA_ID=CAMNT_0038918873 /DNA_START=114 /DNA_END=1046 /DNA_ORIENTATION=+
MLIYLSLVLGISSAASTEAPFTAPPITGSPVTNAPVTGTPVDTAPSLSKSDHLLKFDLRCGIDSFDAKDNCGNICQFSMDCAPGTFCFSTWNTCYLQEDDVTPAPISPPQSQPKSDFRCGVTEVDARSNCKAECTTLNDCSIGEYCWGTHVNYCHMMPIGHPQCDHSTAENVERHCGYDEVRARGFCAPSCINDVDCQGTLGERCYPVHLNLCACFERQDELDQVIPQYRHLQLQRNGMRKETNHEYFERAEEQLNSYPQENSGAENIDSFDNVLDVQEAAHNNHSTAVVAFKYQYMIGSLVLMIFTNYL